MIKKLTPNEAAFESLVRQYGKSNIARAAGVTRQSITKWAAIPGNRAADVAKAFQTRPELVRPDPYAVP